MRELLVQNAWIVGLLVVALVLVQALVMTAGSLRRHAHEQQVLRRQRELLEARVARARALQAATEQTPTAWNGYRKFSVETKRMECGDVCSFLLRPHDGHELPAFEPGQYLTFRLDVPGRDKPVVRCYSLSDAAQPDRYRVTIKRIPPPRDDPDAPPGLVSSYFHQQIEEGHILDVKAPAGHFTLDPDDDGPIVLIGGGVGLTPVLSMINAVAERNPGRETHFFYGVRDGREHMFADHLRHLADRMPNLYLHVCYSAPREDDRLGVDYDHDGRITIDLLKRLLPSSNFAFYICGPAGMMETLTRGLESWGVPEHHIHFEAFGPATVRKTPAPASAAGADATAVSSVEVTFARSKKTVAWDVSCNSLLELAETHGIVMEAGCRAGNCGTCLTAIREGTVNYRTQPGADCEEGSCLACVCVPESSLVLDA